jgi:hypothetical protein
MFGFYLTKGMGGGADYEKDGKIAAREMHKFLINNA